MNRLAMVEAVIVPWAIFVCVAWLLTFSAHYKHEGPMWVLVAACLLVPVAMWYRVRLQREDGDAEPNWFYFLAVVCSLAWLAGFGFGLFNWFAHMKSYYDSSNLALISNVDTRSSRGGQFIDVAALEFTASTDVNESLNMGYKDGQLYCVAPIVTGATPAGGNTTPPAFYDFWAVGVDCCNPFEPKVFACGEPNDDQARGGLRLMDTSLVPNFKKAIQMAQEEYHIKAGADVIFLHWTGDPLEHVNKGYTAGWASFRLVVLVYLAVSLLLMLLEAAARKFA